MVRWVVYFLVFGGFLTSSAMAIAQVEDGRVKILLDRITGDGLRAERLRAEQELEVLGEDAVFGLMLIATENPDDDVRAQAMEALERIVSDHTDWRLPRLVVARIDYSTDREYVSEEFGENSEEFILANVDHSLPQIRRNALYLLSFLELPDTEVMPVFRQGIQDSEPTVRAAAAVGLIRSGEKTPKAIETLVHCVGTDDLNDLIEETIRENERYFHEPLVRRVINPKSTDQVYHDSLDLIEGYHGADALGAAFNPLREALNSENRTVQLRAAMALAKLWYDAPSVANILADEIENAGPMRDVVLDAIEESHLYPPRIEKVILDLTRSDDPTLVRKGLRLAANAGLVERHAGELATHLLEPTRLRTTVNVLGRRSRSLPYKPEYIAPLESLVRTESVDSGAAFQVLLNMEKPGVEAAMSFLHDPELDDRFRAILLQELESRMRHLRKDDPLNEFLDQVAELLSHENLEVACRAAMVLQTSDYSAKSLTPVLLKGYASNAHPLSRDCYAELLQYGKADEEAVPMLLAMLEDADADPDRRNGILMLLNRHGGDSDREVNLFAEYLVSDVDGSAHSQIARKIRQPVAERLASLVDQGPTENRLRAMVALRAALEHSRGSNRTAWKDVEEKTPPPGVITALSAEDEELRFAATMLLLNYQPQAEEALPVLRKVIASDAMGSEWEALQALESYGPAAAPLLPELLAVLRSVEIESTHGFGRPNYHLARRQMVLSLLSKMGPAAAPAVPDLIELLDDPEMGGRKMVTWGYSVPDVLASIGEAAKPAEAVLIKMLPEAENLTPIGKALKSMGGSTEELLSEIDRRLDDPVLCYQAVNELQVICDLEPITPRLIKILKSDNLWLKRDVADMLAVRGLVRDPVLVPLLKELLQEESARVREKAIGALAEHGVPVQLLIERLQNDESMNVRQAVVEALATYGEPLMKAYRRHASRSTDAEIFTSVLRGDLPELSAMAAIPALKEVLRSPHDPSNSAEYLRIEAAYTLAKFGETAKRSLPLLLKLHRTKQDSEELVRFSRRSVEKWQNALLTAIWAIDLETAIENELPRPKPRRDW